MSPDGRNVYVATPAGMTVLARDRANGQLRRLRALDGCVSAGGRGGCRAQAGAGRALAVRVSADGRNVYLLGYPDRLLVFFRDPRSGAVRPLPGRNRCVAPPDTRVFPARPRPGCHIARGLLEAPALALSADGASLYLSVYDGIIAFSRDRRTGAVSQLAPPAGCVAESPGTPEPSCTAVPGVGSTWYLPIAFAVARDGLSLYRAGTDQGVDDSGGGWETGQLAVLARDPLTGALSQPPRRAVCAAPSPAPAPRCGPIERDAARDIAITPDGRSLYYIGAEGISTFARNRATGELRALRPTSACRGRACRRRRTQSRVVIPDDRTVYVLAPNGIDVFRRDPATGALRELPAACWIMPDWPVGACHQLRGVTQQVKYDLAGLAAAMDPSGHDLYILSGASAAIAVLHGR